MAIKFISIGSMENAFGYDDAVTPSAASFPGPVLGVAGTDPAHLAVIGDIGSHKLDDLTAPDDNTDLNATTSAHGLVVKATAPAAGLVNVVGIANGETEYTNKPLFDATAPSTQAFSDAAATGSATVAARRDHKHAMMAAPAASITVADGVYTVGLGITQNGTITISGGVLTAIQEVI